MLYTIGSDIKRAIYSKGFLAGTLSMVVVIALSSLEGIFSSLANSPTLPSGYHALMIINVLTSEPVMLAVPIIASLPFTSAFVDDIQSGFIKQFLPRSGVNSYISGKLIACTLSGGLVISLGIIISYIFSSLVITHMEGPSIEGAIATSYLIILLEKLYIFFFSGMFWSLVGFTLASFTQSRYIAYSSPFIIYYVLVIIYERYLDFFYYLYPKEWLNPTHLWPLGNGGLIIFLLLFAILLSLAFGIFARRKLING
ncbi:hypothetical protein [Clostridium sp. YIM B02551]|uniref:hypothetical protein n=1 Tax=Clostridium sp. YIM B02551 TaxID=2910679 RepID=UPI001EEBABD8|nr:hypothetical protein [Clostridium sp. YIM B02551]